MGNGLGIDLTDKTVVIDQQYLKPLTPVQRCFTVSGGFGAVPYTIGNALYGEFVYDGERCRMEGYMVERLATEEEIEAARQLRTVADTERNRATVLFALTVADVEDVIGGTVSPEHFDDWRKTLANGIQWVEVVELGVPE